MQILAVGQKSVLEARVDEHPIGFVSQAFELDDGAMQIPHFLGIIGCPARTSIGVKTVPI